MAKAFVSGCAGPKLLPEESAFFSREKPWGLILFRRNCVDPQQIRELVTDFRKAVARPDAPVLIDQEGGRIVSQPCSLIVGKGFLSSCYEKFSK